MPRFITLPAKVASAALAALLATAGLAVAGVDLPDPADQAFQKVGLSLPNQASEVGPASKPSTVPPAELPSEASQQAKDVLEKLQNEGGCEFGHETAEDAGADLPSQAEDACKEIDGAATPKGSRQTGESHSEAAPQGSEDTGESASQDGRSNAPTTTPQGSRETGETQSDAGQQTGQEQAEQGQGTGDDASGGRKP